MKLSRTSRFLGLSLRERSILAAEVAVSGQGASVTHVAEFVLPSELSLNKPEAVGDALGHFLRQHRFSASRATVGVPARWLLARERELPPVTRDLAASSLRLQAERQFSGDLKDVVFDYAGEPDPSHATRALLVAMPRQRLEQITKLADSAGLKVLAVTSSSLCLMEAAKSAASASSLLLVLERDGAEVVAGAEAGSPRLLRHVPVAAVAMAGSTQSPAQAGAERGIAPTQTAVATGEGPADAAAYVATVGGEVRRAMFSLPGSNGTASCTMAVWDGIGLDSSSLSALAERAGADKRSGGSLKSLGIEQNGMPAGADAAAVGRFGTAVALALAGAGRFDPPIDLLHSRLAPARSGRLSGRRAFWAGGVGLVILVAAAVSLWDVYARQRELDDLIARREAMAPEVDSAQAMVLRATFAGRWFDNRPPVLACLSELSVAFPEEGTIWVTNLLLRENGKATIDGKAADQRAVLSVLDRLKANRSFEDVKSMDMRESGSGNKREVSFTWTLTFAGSAGRTPATTSAPTAGGQAKTGRQP